MRLDIRDIGERGDGGDELGRAELRRDAARIARQHRDGPAEREDEDARPGHHARPPAGTASSNPGASAGAVPPEDRLSAPLGSSSGL